MPSDPAATAMSEHVFTTEDGLLKFLVSDPLEEYRAQTMLTKEPETIAWIDSWAPGRPGERICFWDVGANIGIYTLYAAMKHPGAAVMSFEPFFKNFVRLKANLDLNHLPNVTAFHLAVGRESGVAAFGGRDDRYGASGNVVLAAAGEEATPLEQQGYKVHETVLKASGSALLTLGIRPPHYLKIDVDGIELDIVEGMTAVLNHGDLCSILMEVNTKADGVAVTEILARHGFTPDDAFNKLANHSRARRSRDPQNTAENWVFTRVRSA